MNNTPLSFQFNWRVADADPARRLHHSDFSYLQSVLKLQRIPSKQEATASFGDAYQNEMLFLC